MKAKFAIRGAITTCMILMCMLHATAQDGEKMEREKAVGKSAVPAEAVPWPQDAADLPMRLAR